MMPPPLLAAGTVQAGAPGRTALRCDIGPRRAVAVAGPSGVRHTFGPPGRPEIDIRAAADGPDVGQRVTTWPHAGHRHLRIGRGRYGYVPWQRFRTPDDRGRGAEDRSGIPVLRDATRAALLTCTGGPGVGGYPLAWLRRDAADLAGLAAGR